MLLRTSVAALGLCVLSGCTIFSWGEDKPTLVDDPNGGPPPSVLQVPPDLTQPAVKNQYQIPKAEAKCAPATTAASNDNSSGASDTKDVEARLKELQGLRDKGLITDEELSKKRKDVLQSL